MIKNVMKNEKGSLTGGPSSGWGNRQSSRPGRCRSGGARINPPEFPKAGRGCQLPGSALGAYLKQQDRAPNSRNLTGTPRAAAAAPRARVSREQVCSNVAGKRSRLSRGGPEPRKLPLKAALTSLPGRGIRALGVPIAPFKFALSDRLRLSGPRAPPVVPAAGWLPALVEGAGPHLPTPLPAQPMGGGARPHVTRARLGSRQNVNEKEERDLKVLAAPAEDKCASFAR